MKLAAKSRHENDNIIKTKKITQIEIIMMIIIIKIGTMIIITKIVTLMTTVTRIVTQIKE